MGAVKWATVLGCLFSLHPGTACAGARSAQWQGSICHWRDCASHPSAGLLPTPGPWHALIRCCRKDLQQEAWNVANDSLRTTLCVRFRAEVVACGIVFTAARRLKVGAAFGWTTSL